MSSMKVDQMMKYCFKRMVLAGAVLLITATVASAELYKWVDADGVVHFSDKPHKEDPSKVPIETLPSVKSKPLKNQANPKTESKTAAPAPAAPAKTKPSVSYADADVELYVTENCRYCTMARDYLNAKGVSFTWNGE